MPEGSAKRANLDFRLEQVEVEPYAAAPTLNFRLRIRSPSGLPIRNIMLQTQIRIEARRRFYSDFEKEQLAELFGEPGTSSHTIGGLFWTQVGAIVPAFENEYLVEIPVTASYDFNLAVTKYFYGLERGTVPLLLLFSGSVAYQNEAGMLQFDQIPWSKEADYSLPLATWWAMIARYYPNEVWLGLSPEVFDRLYRYKRRCGLPNWDRTLESLLEGEEDVGDAEPRPGASA